ncbi:hypothetical protein [Methanoplanus endosymbiosus]|uniref:Uncharacterized protein n=1 Tax=Methanoplanus endosymbiosus TaxID=33865 RepID=A0A9E7PRI1_9EURY|nr:hypothetical protein [Methanoplanus endosymbiosus]UUX92227.1 hypothetical protein L6E24_12860 [Methanoplanus endosymbiosus]
MFYLRIKNAFDIKVEVKIGIEIDTGTEIGTNTEIEIEIVSWLHHSHSHS